MNVITAIGPAARRPGRVELDVDGKSFATLSLQDVERLALTIGQSVAGREDRILAAAAELQTYDRAVNMLAARARSSSELSRALVRKGESRPHVDAAITRLTEQGFLDDPHFARVFARTRVVGAGHSKRRVQQDLARRGIDRAVSEEAVAEVFVDEGVDQRQIVEAAARKKVRALRGCAPSVRKRRLYAFLARRGYESDDIRYAMDAVKNELGEDIERR